jgi:hypothetical protein
MNIPDSVIDPATADLDVWAYVVALKDDDWVNWDSPGQITKYNGSRHQVGRWNLRDLSTGSPVGWGYTDHEVVVLQVISTSTDNRVRVEDVRPGDVVNAKLALSEAELDYTEVAEVRERPRGKTLVFVDGRTRDVRAMGWVARR